MVGICSVWLDYAMDLLKQCHMQGLVNALTEHHPNIGDMISNRYLKVMFKMPKVGHLPKPDMIDERQNAAKRIEF